MTPKILESGLADGKGLLLIVGLQKSGTTLMMRTLRQVPGFIDFAKGEGDEFWGNEPTQCPERTGFGEIYQRRGDSQGHAVESNDVTPALREELRRRLMSERENHGSQAILFNKNPFNSVRMKALRLIFPLAKIVCLVRKPVANIFSLKKRHQSRDRAYDNGWWGVKPPGWQDILRLDEHDRIVEQWYNVNKYIWRRRASIDLFVPYHSFTNSPQRWINRISTLVGDVPRSPLDLGEFECFDDEYLTGASTLPHSRIKAAARDPSIAANEVYAPPFTNLECEKIHRRCDSLFEKLIHHAQVVG